MGYTYISERKPRHQNPHGEWRAFSNNKRFPGQERAFSKQTHTREEVEAYVAAVLAEQQIEGRTKRALLTEEQLDALRTSPPRQTYTRDEPDLTWQECEQLVEDDLRASYPFAFVFVAKNIPGFGSDLGVAFPDDTFWFVEVKKAHTNLTKNEYARAVEQGENYVLAIVDKERNIEYVTNPRDTGTFEPVYSVTYRWRRS